jgi:hypothetical protein
MTPILFFSGRLEREKEDETVAEIREHHRHIMELGTSGSEDGNCAARNGSRCQVARIVEVAGEMIDKWEREMLLWL